MPVLDADLPCPSCGYSLRGLPGATVVTCPECGVSCDRLQALMIRRGDYKQTPEYRALAGPAAYFPVAGLLILVASGCIGIGRCDSQFCAVAVVLFLGPWLAWMISALRYFELKQGLMLTVLLHAAYCGFVYGILALGGTTIGAFVAASYLAGSRGDVGLLIGLAVIWIGCLLWVFTAAPIDRVVGRCCARRWLIRAGGADPEAISS